MPPDTDPRLDAPFPRRLIITTAAFLGLGAAGAASHASSLLSIPFSPQNGGHDGTTPGSASGSPESSSADPSGSPSAGPQNTDGKRRSGYTGDLPVLVNKTTPISPLTYAPSDLVEIGGGQFLRKTAAAQFTAMARAAASSGLTILPVSGYRSYESQNAVYTNYVASHGTKTAGELVAKPGTSEHQLGLAVDVGNPDGSCALEACFDSSPVGAWVQKHAGQYGFIIRYPKDKQNVTGYSYEPWHLRYVGAEVALAMAKGKFTTLEEFIAASR